MTSVLCFALFSLLPLRQVQAARPERQSTDPCRVLLPAALQDTLTRSFPTHRLPISTDNLLADRDYQRAHGGNGCLRVAKGRFFGKKGGDFAVLLTPVVAGGDTLLVVASEGGKELWKATQVWRWVEPTFRLYVDTARPDRYVRSDAVDEPLGKNEVSAINSPQDGVLSGKTEAFEYGFFWQKNEWVYVRIAD